jgi:(+)-pinoresinol hydroxylase
MIKLPAGISARKFRTALEQFRAVVGSEHLYDSEEDVAMYRDAYTPFHGEPDKELLASAALAPESTAQVQEIVRIANRHRIPLYAVSTGRNLGYGGSAPSYSGSVVVDLRRMNKVLEVNDQAGYCVVEPGVSFFDLYRYFEEHRHSFMVATPEPGWGSPIGNALERGVSGVRGENFAAVCGMEVVLGTGELLRTGMGAVPTAKLWQGYRYGFGPYLDGLFSQSNFGIVTKMGFWLVRKPEVRQSFLVTSPRSDDFAALIDTIQGLRDEGLIITSGAGMPIRSSTNRAVGNPYRDFPEVIALLAKPGGGSSSEWDQVARDRKLPAAQALGVLQGPAKVVAATIEHARERFAKIGAASFVELPAFRFPLDPDAVPENQKTGLGIPQLWGFNRLTLQGPNNGHYYFSPNIAAQADDIHRANAVLRKVIADTGDEAMLLQWGWQGGVGFSPKCYTILMDFVVYPDVALNQRRRELFKRMVQAAAENGWAEYRGAPAFHDTIMDAYSFNDHALRRFSETIKDAVDPNGILSPGRSGIWPKHLRGKRS